MENNAMRIYLKVIPTILLFVIAIFSINLSQAEVKVYEITENTGLNKLERIDTMDKYLVELSNSIKIMEAKLSENSEKIKSLESIIRTQKEEQLKKQNEKVTTEISKSSPTSTKDLSELEKLKADFIVLKNNDIEKLKVDFQDQKETINIIQATLRTQLK
jgi:TolA-binding protein